MQTFLKTLNRALTLATGHTPPPPGPSSVDPSEEDVLIHRLTARASGSVHVAHAFTCDNIDGHRSYTVSASIYIPQNFTGRAVELSLHGHQTLSGTPVDMTKRDMWQRVSATAEIPDHQSRLIPALTVDYDGTSSAAIYSKDWQLVSAPRRRSFKHITCAELAAVSPDARIVGAIADVSVPVAPVRYGQTTKPDFPITEHPHGGWESQTMAFRDQKVYELRDAVIHGEEGIVTVGDHVLEETYLLASLDKIKLRWAGDGTASFECTEPTALVGKGSYHFSGYPGNRNYAHWMADILPSIETPATSSDSALILPELYYHWQSETLDMVDTDHVRVLLKGEQTVRCEKLTISYMRLADSGHWPHPDRLAVARRITMHVKPDPAARRRIYISRRDSGARRMVNEAEIIALAEEFGFEILTLTGMPIAEQIRAFAEAEIVLGSHGAGLSNVIFCREGTIFCELLVDGYVQWSMRRLASVVPLRYGCAIGREIGSEVNQHDKQWQIDPDRVREMVQAAVADIP